MFQHALGLIETRGLVGAIEAADTALKTSHIQFIGHDRADAGLITIKIIGETAAVRAAVEAGAAAAQRVGELVASHVIPRPHEELIPLIQQRQQNNKTSDHKADKKVVKPETIEFSDDAQSYKSELNKLTVHELRSLARTIENLSIQGRQISMANKQKLIEELIHARFG